MILFHFILFLICAFSSFQATAQDYVASQPTEIITSTPLSSMSERSRLWPSRSSSLGARPPSVFGFRDSLVSLPGILARESGSPSMSIRGSGQADRTLTLLNGLPLRFDDGIGLNSEFVPDELLAEARVVTTPASVFWGGSALAGALDLRLREDQEPWLMGQFQDGKYGLGKASGTISWPVWTEKDKNFQLSFTDRNDPGGLRDFNNQHLSRVVGHGSQKLGTLEMQELFSFFESRGSLPGPTYSPMLSTFRKSGSLGGVQLKKKLSTAMLGAQLSSIDLDARYDERTTFESRSRTSSQALKLDYSERFLGNFELINFFDMQYGALKSTYAQDRQLDDFSPELGQILNSQWRAESLQLGLGYRYLPKFGQWVLSSDLQSIHESSRHWLTFAEGYRAPSLSDRFASTSYFQANPSLKPERAWQVDLGNELSWSHRLGRSMISAEIFYRQIFDAFDSRNVSANVLTKINRGQIDSQGLTFIYRLNSSFWNFGGTYSYLDQTAQDNEPTRLAPVHQGSAEAGMQLGPVASEWTLTYLATTKDYNPITGRWVDLPGWTTLDWQFRTLGLQDWSLAWGVRNVFDVSREFTLGYPEDGRRFFVLAQYFL